MPTALDILNQSTLALVTVNRELLITFLNQTAEALIGHSRAHALNRKFDDFFHESPVSRVIFTDVFDKYKSITLRELSFNPIGQSRSLMVNVSLVPLDTEEVLLEIQAMDRILQIRTENQIYNSQAASQSLIRALAHEIRNPLGGIRGAAQLLEQQLDYSDQREFTQVIITESDRLRNLVDRLLGPIGQTKPRFFNIHEIIERVLKISTLEERSKSNRLQIDREYDPSVPEIKGNADNILQAILNIVTNALDALESTKSPQLRVTTTTVGQFTVGRFHHRVCANIQIENNGPKIPIELQSQIFLPLISNKEGGSGLGLAIAQNVIQAHNGLITCESDESFTRFHIYLPIDSEATRSI